MSALSRTLPALIAASVLLLAGCDKVADKVADNAAGQIDDQKARSEFVTNCAKSAVESSKGSINNAVATKLCGCTYDQAASTYSNSEEWKKDLIRYGLNQNNKELEAKIQATMTTCIDRFSKGQL
ncbi:hypothetical protein A7Q01_09220 [Eikenella sp. NML96-A-049]|uniref:hypothetical protein n=1 Tax=unclassified Eikenella TaxID=2639367 RepID=UPI0007E25394|nr:MULTISPECIES: hypothetical protein [unclassified Eikenella]OAM34805.1 hypothetical protein A7P97_06560 [Eikenella sp. NML070372]OAM39546.1 hypothetical protein A7Q01_09220 [Eikenella sp. NML96-A-049]